MPFKQLGLPPNRFVQAHSLAQTRDLFILFAFYLDF